MYDVSRNVSTQDCIYCICNGSDLPQISTHLSDHVGFPTFGANLLIFEGNCLVLLLNPNGESSSMTCCQLYHLRTLICHKRLI